MPQIIYNGKTYASLEEMPPEVRKVYELTMGILADNDHNGIPDFLEGKAAGKPPAIQATRIQIEQPQFIADGRVYTDAAKLPKDKRQKLAQAMARLDPLLTDIDGNGKELADILQKEIDGPVAKSTPEKPTAKQEFPDVVSQNPPSSMVVEEKPNYTLGAVIMLGILFIVVLLGIGVYLVIPLLK